MEYTQSPEDAVRIAKTAFGLVGKHGVTPTPHNFTIWYNYVADSYPELTRAIKTLVENNAEFTDLVNSQLYEKFFTVDAESDAMHDIAQKIEKAMENILGQVNNAGIDAKEYGRVLNKVSQELSGETADDDLENVVKTIVAATRKMEARTRVLETQLAETSRQVTDLRVEVEETRREASTDPLTGIANRKMFDSALSRAMGEARKTGESLCLLMIDIDHFKKFNDEHGHQLGDQVLKLLAVTLTESIKGKDTASRYGGEEFTVILPGTSREDAVILAEQIRRRLATKNIVNRKTGRRLGTITMSIGVSMYRPGEPADQIIYRADTALYAAKNQGRNRVMSEVDLQVADVSARM